LGWENQEPPYISTDGMNRLLFQIRKEIELKENLFLEGFCSAPPRGG
jgi:hypothetical protein